MDDKNIYFLIFNLYALADWKLFFFLLNIFHQLHGIYFKLIIYSTVTCEQTRRKKIKYIYELIKLSGAPLNKLAINNINVVIRISIWWKDVLCVTKWERIKRRVSLFSTRALALFNMNSEVVFFCSMWCEVHKCAFYLWLCACARAASGVLSFIDAAATTQSRFVYVRNDDRTHSLICACMCDIVKYCDLSTYLTLTYT